MVTGPVNISSEKLAQGKTIFENSCGRCHDLPEPTKHTSVQWVGIMNAMAPKAKLNDEQHQMVYDYIVSVKKQ
ncbi:cytochrome c2 [Chryseobacterium sp. H1D6B]|uniref:c-type cytochrome n=1 Tax=Chryseobacterium sp. H1D6B TaxID=2940588 RepID=UPI0017EF3022|nr:cytochrome C [Chryseobacterium sp. H1D6B]MDH6251417.1 cytochrome c2 [Chryseobacterium sp. H1D6B]